MSDAAAQPWSDDASPAPTAAATPGAGRADPLAGDWSEGLAGAAREHGVEAPQRIDGAPAPAQTAVAPAGPTRAAEEVAAEAAGAVLPAESVRTEQASAQAIFALAQQKAAARQPATPPAAAAPAETAPVDIDVAAAIGKAIALESGQSTTPPLPSPAQPPAADQPKSAADQAADDWAQATANAGPDLWGAAAPAEGAWAAGPAAAAGPDWSAAPADAAAQAAWDPPAVKASTDPTLVHPSPISGEDDLPVPVAATPPPGQPAFLAGEPRVVVHTLAGRVKRGTLRAPDLAKPELRLSPQMGGAEERIALTDVKAVFFMLSPGEQPPDAPGGRVRVTLSDGRLLDGFRESDGPGGGLFLVPLDAARTNTRSIFVCGDAIQAIDQA